MNQPPGFLPPQECESPYSVSQINEGIARLIEAGNTTVWVEGEISNFRRATSGHCYLKLKDANSQVPAVLWRTYASKLEFEPADGMAVRVVASIRVYQKGGYYQLDIFRMMPAGVGALYAAFEKLKARLEAEGLFSEERKRPVPKTVRTLGVVTAKGGAAIRDIITVVSRRAPQTDILLYNAAVQGEKAAGQIAAGIAAMNEHGAADCIIVGRGGGSIEDLWAFNDERVARAISASKIPVISAVGHEIDFTIADFVADVRAPTPSAAAETAVADQEESRRYFASMASRFTHGFHRYFEAARTGFDTLAARMAARAPARRVREARQHADDLHERHRRAMAVILDRCRHRMERATGGLHALSPLAVLARGYSVVRKHGGATVRNASQLDAGEEIGITFHAGTASARVTALRTDSQT